MTTKIVPKEETNTRYRQPRKMAAPQTPRDVRQWILKHTDLLTNLGRMADGRRVRTCGPTGKLMWRQPSWEDQLWAMKELLPKVCPNLTAAAVELSGPEGDPILVARAEALKADPRELARRLSLLLSFDPEIKAVIDADRAARNGTMFEGSLAGPQEAVDAPGGSTTAADPSGGDEAAPESTEGLDESAELTPPPEGTSLWFGLLEVRNIGPCRDGLPPMYALHRGGQEVMRSNWVACLAKAEKLLDGVPLPPGRLAETRPDGAVLRRSLTREQRSTERGIHP